MPDEPSERAATDDPVSGLGEDPGAPAPGPEEVDGMAALVNNTGDDDDGGAGASG